MTMSDWYADATFVIDLDRKSNTGGLLTMGKVVIKKTMNNKINTKSSTEAELVASNDVL